MSPNIIPKDNQEWIMREKLVSCYLKYINKTEFPDEMINLLKRYLDTGDMELKEIIDDEYGEELLEMIKEENINMEQTADRLYSLDMIIGNEFDIDIIDKLSMKSLLDIHKQIKDLSNSIVQEYFMRVCTKQEILPSEYEYNLVFEWIKDDYRYLCDFSNAISFYNILYEQQENGLLPNLSGGQLSLFGKTNWDILYNKYLDLVEYFVDNIDYDENINSIINTCNRAFNLLEMYSKNSTTSEAISDQIYEWKEEIGDECADIIEDIFDCPNELSANDFENWTDKILEFSPDNVKALKIKIWCQEQKINEK